MTDKRNLMTVIKRIAFTLLIILIYVMGTYIPVPFVEITARYQDVVNNTPISAMSIMSGADFLKLSIFMVGLNPFMIAVLILQLSITIKLFGIDALPMDQIQIIQQIIIFVITIVQSTFVTVGLLKTKDLMQNVVVILILSAGSMLVTWMCFMNIKFGVGGTSPVILINILTSMIPTFFKIVRNFHTLDNYYLWIILIITIAVITIYFWVAFSHAYYPLQTINPTLPSYSKPVTVPIGLNLGAMMTYMMGMALLSLPAMIQPYLGENSLLNNAYFNAGLSFVITFLLFYFFTFIQFNPKDQAKALRDANNYVIGVRPGKPTQKYLRKLLLVITLPGALITASQLTLGLWGSRLFGAYAGLAVIPMNISMIAMFTLGIKDQVETLFYPYRYRKLTKDE
ncbi:MAG: accessory Sec system protein translocase subunit SecY2 [Lactobacillus sp.]